MNIPRKLKISQIVALQLARDSGAIMLSLPDRTMDRLQPCSVVFLYAPEILLAETGK